MSYRFRLAVVAGTRQRFHLDGEFIGGETEILGTGGRHVAPKRVLHHGRHANAHDKVKFGNRHLTCFERISRRLHNGIDMVAFALYGFCRFVAIVQVEPVEPKRVSGGIVGSGNVIAFDILLDVEFVSNHNRLALPGFRLRDLGFHKQVVLLDFVLVFNTFRF